MTEHALTALFFLVIFCSVKLHVLLVQGATSNQTIPHTPKADISSV